MSRRISTAGLVFLLLVSSGCDPRGDQIEGDEIETKVRADNAVAAVVTRAGHGATVPYVYRVYLRPNSNGAVKEVLRADKVERLQIQWEHEGNLVIRMSCGKVFNFSNFFYAISERGDVVTRVLVKLDIAGFCDYPMISE